MPATLDAVYENGMLRLIQPILLPEGTHVEVTVTPKPTTPNMKTPAEILATIAAMEIQTGAEEHASRDHDKILYGDQEAG